MLQKFDLSKKYIFSQVKEEDIFAYYLGHENVNLKDMYVNPLRHDVTPGCSYFIRDSDHRLIFNDFAWRQFDCFDVVKVLFRVSFYKAMEIIYNDLIEKQPRNQPIIDKEIIRLKSERRLLKLRIRRRKFRKEELAFWSLNGKLDVTEEELYENKIYCLDCFEENHVLNDNCKMTFAYHWFDYNYQLYFPEHKPNTRKFINPSGIKWGDLEFLNHNANYVVITKSKKDSFYLRKFGVNAFFVVNERIMLPQDLMDSLSDLHIFTLFDKDGTGKRLTIEYKQNYGTTPLLVDDGKDFTEFVKLNPINDIVEIIDELKSQFNLCDE